MKEQSEIIEAKIDALVQQGVHPYDIARQMHGVEAPDNSDFTADAILARNPEMAFSAADDAAAEADDAAHYGVNHAAWERASQDPEQRRINQAGIAAARQAITHSLEQ